MKIWYLVKIKKSFPKIERFVNSPNLFVKINTDVDDDELINFTLWNGGIDGSIDFETLSLHEAIDHLDSLKDNKGKRLKIQDETLDLKWFKCIYANNTK